MSDLQQQPQPRRRVSLAFAHETWRLIERCAEQDHRMPNNYLEWLALQEARRRGLVFVDGSLMPIRGGQAA